MKAKSSTQMGHFRRFSYLMFANCVHANNGILFTSERGIIFPPNHSKFAVECDWNSKNSQNVQSLGFFKRKIDGFFEEKS